MPNPQKRRHCAGRPALSAHREPAYEMGGQPVSRRYLFKVLEFLIHIYYRNRSVDLASSYPHTSDAAMF